MTGPAPLPPYGFVGIPLPGGRRYFALGPGGPVTTWQQVAGARRSAQAAIQREREAGIEVPPGEEQERITERLAAVGGSLSQRQYDRLRELVFNPTRDRTHPNWSVARSRDPNVIALWLQTIRDTSVVWLAGFGAIHHDTDPLGGATTAWKTLGDVRRNIQYAHTARQPAQLHEYLDPNVLQQFWSVDQYVLRWTR